jgi:lipid II:glycine glycyltransferase (peptidoglycan interpeptide bridge formation enzyme)
VVKTPSESSQWDKQVESRTGWCHFIQGEVWADVRSQFSWPARKLTLRLNDREIPLISYSRSTRSLGRLHYIPKLAQIQPTEIGEFTSELRKATGKGLAVRLELDQPEDEKVHQALVKAGWQKAPHIQYDTTVLIDLNKSVKEIYASFKTRARWEISAAQRRDTTVKQMPVTEENLAKLYEMMHLTAQRANFRNRSAEFSMKYWQAYAEAGQGFLYFAYHEGDLLSAAYIIKVGKRAFYKDSGSIRAKQNVFASRVLQWQVMQDLREMGCTTYDMVGVPRAGNNDPSYKGVGTFKTAFAEPTDLQGSYMLPLAKNRYKLWQKLEPKFMMAYIKLTNNVWY